jgi:hypothetical protein
MTSRVWNNSCEEIVIEVERASWNLFSFLLSQKQRKSGVAEPVAPRIGGGLFLPAGSVVPVQLRVFRFTCLCGG